MPTDIATYIVAQRAGIRLDKYLDLDTIETVNRFMRDLDAVEGRAGAVTADARRPTRKSGAKEKGVS